MNKKVTAIILAAGLGSRMNSGITKQRMLICGESVVSRSVGAFQKSELVTSIIVVCRKEEIDFIEKELRCKYSKVKNFVVGGNTRAESAMLGFKEITEETDFVAIHDAARCLISVEEINKVISSAFIYGGATASVRVTDTLKRADKNGFIKETVAREGIYSAQTPQVFSVEIYKKAIEQSFVSEEITDDNLLFERIGEKVFLVETGRENIKITTPEDIALAESILKRRCDNG